MALISFILAEMSISDDGVDHIENIDLNDNIDHIDTDHEGVYIEGDNEINILDIEPTPFMLIFSSFLLIFGFSGILFCYFLIDSIKFLAFIIPPFITYFFTRLVNYTRPKDSGFLRVHNRF